MPRPILTITQVARRFGISTRTIRLYAEEGFISLERRQGRCLLRPGDVDAIARIERLKADLGVNLAGVGVILEMREKMIELRRRLVEMEREFQRLLAGEE
ncbi:MAG: MerR family transcriptional regulator [Thermodesulfobacteriota bacterium]